MPRPSALPFLLLIGLLLPGASAWADSPLAPLKTDSPRDTMRSFLAKMDQYRAAARAQPERARELLDDALRCLDLNKFSGVNREDAGRRAAVFLKEVIDRVIVIDYEKIPDHAAPVERFRLKDTEIVIHRMAAGDRQGEFLFSADTALQAERFFRKVHQLPYLEGSGGGAAYQAPWLERALPPWSRRELLGLAIWQWLALTLVIFAGLLMRNLALLTGAILRRFTSRSSARWDDLLVTALARPVGYLAATGVWFAALKFLSLSDTAETILAFVIKVLFYAALTYLLYCLAAVLSQLGKQRIVARDQAVNLQLVRLVELTLKALVVVFGVLLGAQNLGIDVFSLVAGLGIGGLAVALAAKDTLANFFGSLMIMLDQPFKVGHWVKLQGSEGTIEEIGFRSTKLRTFYDSVITIPNSEIVMTHVDNLGLRNYRRTVATLGVTYDTPAEKLEAFLEGIKNIIKANAYTRKDCFHIVFAGFGASSLDILLYFFFQAPDWATELVQRQHVHLEILRLAEDLGVRFAFPSQSLYVETLPTPTAPSPPPAPRIDAQRFATIARRYGQGGEASRPEGSGLYTAPYLETARS